MENTREKKMQSIIDELEQTSPGKKFSLCLHEIGTSADQDTHVGDWVRWRVRMYDHVKEPEYLALSGDYACYSDILSKISRLQLYDVEVFNEELFHDLTSLGSVIPVNMEWRSLSTR
jgi:hypothetical protein